MIRTLIAINDLREAVIQLKKISIVDPNSDQAFNLLGVIYEKSGNHEGAGIMYSTSLSLNPDYTPARHNLSRLLRQNSADISNPDLGGDWFHNIKTKHSK